MTDDLKETIRAFDSTQCLQDFFNHGDEKKSFVHEQLWVDDYFLGLLGVGASEIRQSRLKPNGLENAFNKWLQSGATMLEFVAILRVLQNAVLARALSAFDQRIMTLYNFFVVPGDEIASQRDKVAALAAAARRLWCDFFLSLGFSHVFPPAHL